MSRKKLWRPTLFSALGAGFKSDDTVNDGIHLRWNFDSRLGLPFEKGNTTKGNFKVFVMNQPEKSINNVDLFKGNRKAYRIESADLFNINPNSNAQSTIFPFNNKIYFIKRTQHEHVALDWHYKNVSKYINALNALQLQPTSPFLKYMDGIMDGFRPFYFPTKSEWEIAEVCAVDIDFTENPDQDTFNPRSTHRTHRRPRKKFTMQQFKNMNAKNATKLAGDLSKFANITNHSIIKNAVSNFKIKDVKRVNAIKKPKINAISATINSTIIGNFNRNFNIGDHLIANAFKNDVYVRVKAWNRDDQLIDQDWIGKRASNNFAFRGRFGSIPNATVGKLKKRIKLRGAGIEYITFEFVPNKPIYYPKFFKYVFCEDYCRSTKIWSSNTNFETRFNANTNFHTSNRVKNEHYAPFKDNFNWAELSHNLRQHFINDPHVTNMLSKNNTYDTYMYKAQYDAPDAEIDTEDTIKLPMLPSLISASVDPAFANILGLYMYINQLQQDGRDFKVEGDFPFFSDENIAIMDEKLAQLLTNNPSNSILKGLKFTLQDITLCGLILGPRINKKPAPPITAPLDSEAKAIDLPNQNNPKVYDLFGDAQIKIPFSTNEIKPYRRIIAVALDKSLNNSPFENIIEAEEDNLTALDGFSILPGVYMPRTKNGVLTNPMEIDDYFSMPAIDDNTLQYQARGFDIFGRPSKAAQGKVHKLPLPCKAPQGPANLSGQIVTKGDALHFEVIFSLLDGTLPLTATKTNAELWLHDLPVSTEPPHSVTWAGNKTSKLFSINYDNTGSRLNINTITSHCSQLSWSGNTLNRNNANSNLCNTAFSNATPVLTEINPPSFPLGDTGFRTYKLSWQIASKSALTPGIHQWACRIRVKGICVKTGKEVFSVEPVVTATTNITPPPPPVQQPPLTNIPESTYPDHKGDAYYPIDLNDFIAPGDRPSKPLVRLYTITIDKLFNDVSTIVNGEALLNETQFLNAAKSSKLPFKLINTNPIRYDANNRFVEVKVPGNIEAYHVVGVIGCNAYLEELSWSQTGIVLFKTPALVSIPPLEFVYADPFIETNSSKIALQFAVNFPSALADANKPPRLQLFRKNNTLGDSRHRFVDSVEGQINAKHTPDNPSFNFDYIDDEIVALNRYEYEAHLLIFSEKHGHYIKSQVPVTCTAIGEIARNLSFSDSIDEPLVVLAPDKTTITFEFDAGEYDFSLTKTLNDGTQQRHTGKIRQSTLTFKSFKAKLLVNARYTLIFEDPDTNTGTYTLRVSYGQLFTWTKKIEMTP